MRSNGRLLLSRIGQLRRPFSPSALHSANFVRFYSSHSPIPSEQQRGFWHVLKSYLGWNKHKQESRVIVPEAKKSVIDRKDDYFKSVLSGGHFLVPTVTLPGQTASTKDRVLISACGSLLLKIVDPKLAVEIPMQSVMELAHTKMRDETKKMTYNEIYNKGDILNAKIQIGINEIAKDWGLECNCYQLMDIRLRNRWRELMEWHLDEPRRKRAAFMASRGHVFNY